MDDGVRKGIHAAIQLIEAENERLNKKSPKEEDFKDPDLHL